MTSIVGRWIIKIRDEALWQKQCAEFAEDPNPMARDFQRYVEIWAELAEAWIAAERREIELDSGEDLGLSWRYGEEGEIRALRATLREAENQAGRWTIGFVGQALLIFMTHWAEIIDSEDFARSLTPIELNVALDTAAAWKIEMDRQAEAGA